VSGKDTKERERRGEFKKKKKRKSSTHFRSKEKQRAENKRDCKGYKEWIAGTTETVLKHKQAELGRKAGGTAAGKPKMTAKLKWQGGLEGM
jgi:hypothetical protein